MAYEIKVEAFEGPFDLLFHLINKDEIDIYDIPIVDITKQYIEYINMIQELDMDLASEFLVMAATLIEIKSKMLLPNKDIEEYGYDLLENDPRRELVMKLIEYKKYREVANHFNDREVRFGGVVTRAQSDMSEYAKTLSNEELNEGLEKDILMEGLKRVLLNVGKVDLNRKDYFESLTRDKYSVEDKMQFLRENILLKKEMSFFSLFDEATDKQEVISIFLAILELLKLKTLKVTQENDFDDIKLVVRTDIPPDVAPEVLEDEMEVEIEEDLA